MTPPLPRAQIKKVYRYLYMRQMQLDMMQYTGILAKPCLMGWKYFVRQFEQTLRKHYPGEAPQSAPKFCNFVNN